MSEAVREMTYEEQIANAIIRILAIETPFGIKRDLISTILSLSYRHERDVKNALYTPLSEPPKEKSNEKTQQHRSGDHVPAEPVRHHPVHERPKRWDSVQ